MFGITIYAVAVSNSQWVELTGYQSQTVWKKYTIDVGVICDRRIPIAVKGNMHRTMIRPVLIWCRSMNFEKK